MVLVHIILTRHPLNLHQCIYSTIFRNLCVPKLGDQLGDANIIRLERVESITKSDGADAESPHGEGADERDTALGKVVDDA